MSFNAIQIGNSHVICSNCSTLGHTSRQCLQPIRSYGFLLFRFRSSWDQAEALVRGGTTGHETVSDGLEILLIQRRDSIPFVELMRGKYKLGDQDYILTLLNGMTQQEREKISSEPFDSLWEQLWGPPQEGTHAYRHEKEIARSKLESLRAGTPTNLVDLLKRVGPAWETPEWGFPKGRKEVHESEFACAIRELWEETNLSEKDVRVIRNLEPLEETFVGSNTIRYTHRYYIAYVPPGMKDQSYEEAAKENAHIRREVGDIRWMPYTEALERIRPNSPEKKRVILRLRELLNSYCPLLLGAKQRG